MGAPRVSTRRIAGGYWAVIVAASVVNFVVPASQMVSWAVIGAVSAGAVVVGIRLHRPRRTLPWWLISVSLLLFIAGDTTNHVLSDLRGQDTFPSWPELMYAAMVGTLLATMLTLPRLGATGRDRAGILDALIFTVGVGLLFWVFLVGPYLRHPELPPAEKALPIAYSLLDLLMLALGVRLLVTVRRTASVLLLTAGCVGLLVGDVAYGLAQVNEDWQRGGPVDVAWIVFYAA